MNNHYSWHKKKIFINESLSSAYTPFLTYHSIKADNAIGTHDFYTLSESQFEAQMRFLYEHGYTGLNLIDFFQSSTTEGGRPKKTFILTFDDGYEDFYNHACPILRKYGFVATVFLVSDLTLKGCNGIDGMGRPRLSWEQIKALSAEGFCFGSHTCSHAHLPDLNNEQIRHELFNSKENLKAGLGKEILWLAYPYGESTPVIRKTAMQAGYQAAFGVSTGEPGLFNLWRVGISSKDSMRTFIFKLTRWYSYYRTLLGWVRENTSTGRYLRRIKKHYRWVLG